MDKENSIFTIPFSWTRNVSQLNLARLHTDNTFCLHMEYISYHIPSIIWGVYMLL